MKILHIASEYPPQKVFGLGRFVQDLAFEQARQKHEVHVVTNSLGGRDQETIDHGVNLHRVYFPPPPKPVGAGAMVTQFNIQCIERVFADKICLDAGVVFAHDWLTGLAAKVIARRIKAELALVIHDIVVGKKFGKLDNESKYAGNAEYWLCREADIIICVSRHTRDELIKTYGAAPNKTYAIHNAVSKNNFPDPAPKDLSFFRHALAEENEKIILYVGRLDKEKGIDILLQSFYRILQQGNQARLVIAGKGDMETSLREEIKRLKIEQSVLFAGYISGDVLNYVYHCADIQVVPSLYEPFGIVALEGMICGAPVIASTAGGLSEIIEDGKSGIYVKPGDLSSLANALLDLLNDADKRSKIAKAGYHRALAVFSWERTAKRIDEIILNPEAPRIDETHIPRLKPECVKEPQKKDKKILFIVQTHSPDFKLLELNITQFRSLVKQGHQVMFLCQTGESEKLSPAWKGIASAIEVNIPKGHKNLVHKTLAGYISALRLGWDWLVKMDSDTLITGDINAFITKYEDFDAVGAPSTFAPVLNAIKKVGPPHVPSDCLQCLDNRYMRGFFYAVRREALEKALIPLRKLAPRMLVEDATVTACLASTGAKIAFCEDFSYYLSKKNFSFNPDSPAINIESRDPEELKYFAEKALESFLNKTGKYHALHDAGLGLSVVTQARNRSDFLMRLLKTLKDDWPSDNAELIIVDYGGTDKLSSALKKLDIKNLRYIYADEPGRFSSSHARNIGYKASTGKYILSLDCDLLLPPGFISNIMKELKKNPDTAIFGPVYKLMPGEQDALESGNMDPLNDFEKLKNKSLPHRIDAPSGAIIVAPRKSVLEIGGYDEEYVGYGFQDIDFIERLKRSGLAQSFPESIYALHQFHGYPPDYNTPEIELQNRRRFLSQPFDSVRNKGKNWGQLPQGNIDLQTVTWLEGRNKGIMKDKPQEKNGRNIIIWCEDSDIKELEMIVSVFKKKDIAPVSCRWIASNQNSLDKAKNCLSKPLSNHRFELHSTAQLTTQIARAALLILPGTSSFCNDLSQSAERLNTHWVVVGKNKTKDSSLETLNIELDKIVSQRFARYKPLKDISVPRKILVGMDEGIGNMIMLTPALRALHQLYPAAEIDVIGSKSALQVIKDMPGIKRLIDEAANPEGFYDLMIITGWRRSFKHRLKGVKVKFPPLIAPKMSFSSHETEQHMALIRKLGYTGPTPKPYCAYKTFDLEKTKRLKIGLADTTNPLPGWNKKRWPHYRELAERLINEGNTVFAFGDANDACLYSDNPWPSGVISFQGKLELLETAGAIKNLDLLIANDSGLAHISAALKTPLICLWGPSRIEKNAPLVVNVLNMSKKMPCSPCQMTEAWDNCTNWKCLREITANHVMDTIHSFINRTLN